MQKNKKLLIVTKTTSAITTITAAALALPGLSPNLAKAAEDDSVDFQYSHYQEGNREGLAKYFTRTEKLSDAPNLRAPIEVDSLHGSTRVSLTDRVKFAFNYTQDTWSGATPLGSAPQGTNSNSFTSTVIRDGKEIIGGASPYATTALIRDSQGNVVVSLPQLDGQTKYVKVPGTVHVMSYASPETRKQGDFKLTYEWDEAAVDIGGGISLERDYESRFLNLGGRMDFNQKQTTVNLGLSYTNSDIDAVLEPLGYTFYAWGPQHEGQINFDKTTNTNTLRGNRQDWSAHLGLTQLVNKDSVAELGIGYTRSTGFLENPYKLSWLFGLDPEFTQTLPDGYTFSAGKGFVEQRPNVRNQWNWNARWVQYVESLDAALHLDYSFAHDDWGINAHTFAADWVQPLGAGWMLTPRIRYYSQSKADFYAPFFETEGVDKAGNPTLPDNFSSDQRLSGYGTLSGGVTVSKDFAKGIRLETGFEYYTHQGSLKLGSGGEDSFADFDYWVANAALKVNLSALGQGSFGSGHNPTQHGDHPNIPAGVLFGHTLAKAGDMMLGYRYMRNMQGGDILHNTGAASEDAVINQACPGGLIDENSSSIEGCSFLPREMTMNMHMLDIMYAPTNWLTLMLMPQFMDMDMGLYVPDSLDLAGGLHGSHSPNGHETGGIGDTGMYALVKLFDRQNHHLHATVGFSAPTGDVDIKIKDHGRSNNRDGTFVHYGMQLGSGTWDFKPSLTYTGKAEDWSWGAQVGGSKRLEGKNESGYALGDLFETSVWGGYGLTHWLSTTVRVAYTWQGSIKGRYPRSTRDDSAFLPCNKSDYTYQDDTDGDGIPDGPFIFDEAGYKGCFQAIEDEKLLNDGRDRPSPMDAPSNYGGHYVDVGFGLNATIPRGALAGSRLSFEWLQPVYTNVNGYQLDRDGALSFTWSYGF